MPAIAFYTLGDSGDACILRRQPPAGTSVPDTTQSYRALAARLVGRHGTAYGVNSIQDAIAIVNGAGSGGTRLDRIYFVGHGRRSGDFIFQGRRISPRYFRVGGQWTATDNGSRSTFAQALHRAASPAAEVWLYYCWSAGAFAQALIDAGFNPGQIHSTTAESVVHTDCVVNRQQQVVPVPRVSPLSTHGTARE